MAAVEHARRRNRRRRGTNPWDEEEWQAYRDEPAYGYEWEGNDASP
jgi:hypothetical protein